MCLSLQRLRLVDYNMETLPSYLQDLNPKILHVDCDLSLLTSVASGKSGPEWNKFSHIQQVQVYANDDENNIGRKWYVLYTKDPFSFRTNISPSTIVLGYATCVCSHIVCQFCLYILFFLVNGLSLLTGFIIHSPLAAPGTLMVSLQHDNVPR